MPLPPVRSKPKPRKEIGLENPDALLKAVVYSPQYTDIELAIKIARALKGVGRVNTAKAYVAELRAWKRIDRLGIISLGVKYQVLIY